MTPGCVVRVWGREKRVADTALGVYRCAPTSISSISRAL